MRKIELEWMHASILIGALAVGCGAKTNDSAILGDTAETAVDDGTNTDGTGGGTSGTGGGAESGGGSSNGNTDTGASGGGLDTGSADGVTDTDEGPVGPTIREVQDGLHDGATVTLASVVVASPLTRRGTGFYIADPAGGEKSGLWVYSDWLDDADDLLLSVGEKVSVTGVVSEYVSDGEDCGDCSVTQMRLASSSDLVLDGTTVAPVPTTVAVSALESATTAEPWESVVVAIDAPEIMMDESGDRYIGSSLAIGDAFVEADDLRAGDKFERLIGVLEFRDGRFVFAPRSADDLVGVERAGVSCPADKCAADLMVGDLVISEIMNESDGCGDAARSHDGEYIEVYNATGGTIDLQGLDIGDASSDTYVSASTVVPAGGYGLLSYTYNCWAGTEAHHYGYGSVRLNDDTDTISLAYGGAVLDSVTYGATWPFDNGRSMQFVIASGVDLATENDDAANWCLAAEASLVSAYGGASGSSDHGTPGAANVCE